MNDRIEKARVFVTGASGYVGRAVCRTLVTAGHSVTGMTRSSGKFKMFADSGVTPIVGDLHQTERLKAAATGHDVLIHLAFDYDVQPQAGDDTDLQTIDSLLAVADASPDPCQVIYTSNGFLPGGTETTPVVEETPLGPSAEGVARIRQEQRVLRAAAQGTAAAVVRVGMVYGGYGGTVGDLFESGHVSGEIPCIEDGSNRWAMTHQADLADLYLRIVEDGAAGIFHGVDDACPTMREVVFAVAGVTSSPAKVRHESLAEARNRWGVFADTLRRHVVVTAPRSRALGWRPGRIDFLSSVEEAHEEWLAGRLRT